MRRDSLTLRARYIFPVEGDPIHDGCLTIDGGRIGWLGPASVRKPDLDLGNVAITPGFVNAHTHLELTRLEESIDLGEVEEEVAWLKRVIQSRRTGTEETLRDNASRNVRACLEAGTTTIADTTSAGISWSSVARAPLRGLVFSEIIGLKQGRGMETHARALEWLRTISPEEQLSACARPGLSPHAPYSTSGWLYHGAVEAKVPLSTHLAEMPEELRLLENRDGPLRKFLEELGAWDEVWEPVGTRPLDYVRKGELRNADWILAHGTYLDPADFWQLRPNTSSGHRAAVAYCPRTHARFGHVQHPYRALLESGAIVCLGTDSLASSPTLSILDEIRFLHERDESLSGPLLLTMATLFGAWALRAETTTGSLKVGKSADLALVALPDREEEDPHALLLESDCPVSGTVFEGDFVSGNRVGL